MIIQANAENNTLKSGIMSTSVKFLQVPTIHGYDEPSTQLSCKNSSQPRHAPVAGLLQLDVSHHAIQV